MAPRPPETLQSIRARARQGLPVRFQGKGMAHHTHGIVFEAGVYRVRRLELPAGAMEAFIARHQMFMPENAEALSEPIGEIVLEAQSLEALLERLDEVW